MKNFASRRRVTICLEEIYGWPSPIPATRHKVLAKVRAAQTRMFNEAARKRAPDDHHSRVAHAVREAAYWLAVYERRYGPAPRTIMADDYQ